MGHCWMKDGSNDGWKGIGLRCLTLSIFYIINLIGVGGLI